MLQDTYNLEDDNWVATNNLIDHLGGSEKDYQYKLDDLTKIYQSKVYECQG